jgi:hypothetical protein
VTRVWSALGAGVVAGVVFVAATPTVVSGRSPAPVAPVSAPAGEVGEAVSLPLAPCASDDGPGPCVWDASSRGNGQGRSFVMYRDGSVMYLD